MVPMRKHMGDEPASEPFIHVPGRVWSTRPLPKREYGDGSIPAELAFLVPAVSPEPSTPCYLVSALALALRLLSSEPHRFRQ